MDVEQNSIAWLRSMQTIDATTSPTRQAHTQTILQPTPHHRRPHKQQGAKDYLSNLPAELLLIIAENVFEEEVVDFRGLKCIPFGWVPPLLCVKSRNIQRMRADFYKDKIFIIDIDLSRNQQRTFWGHQHPSEWLALSPKQKEHRAYLPSIEDKASIAGYVIRVRGYQAPRLQALADLIWLTMNRALLTPVIAADEMTLLVDEGERSGYNTYEAISHPVLMVTYWETLCDLLNKRPLRLASGKLVQKFMTIQVDDREEVEFSEWKRWDIVQWAYMQWKVANEFNHSPRASRREMRAAVYRYIWDHTYPYDRPRCGWRKCWLCYLSHYWGLYLYDHVLMDPHEERQEAQQRAYSTLVRQQSNSGSNAPGYCW